MRQRSATVEAVSALFPELARVAVLLTDDPDDAVRLLTDALRRPHALDDPGTALRALAGAATRRRRWAAEQVIGSLPPAVPTDADPVLADVLRSLPDRSRAALVLQLVGGLSSAELDEATGGDLDVDALDVDARDVDATVGRVQGALDRHAADERRARLVFQPPGSPSAPRAPATPLPERLARLAVGRPLPPTAAETIATAVGTARHARRRRGLSLLAGAATVAVLAVLVPLLPQGAPPPAAATVYAGGPHGSLAGDEDFLRAVRDLPGLGEENGYTRRVVFAGDVPGGRWVLIASGRSRERPAIAAWFAGPSGAPPEQLRLLSARFQPDPAEPVSLTDPVSGALVVVGAPGDRILVSERPEIAADGILRRDLRAVPTSRGTATVVLTPVPGAEVSAARLEVRRGDSRVDAAPPIVVLGPDAVAVPVAAPTVQLRPPAAPSAGDAAVGPALRTVLGQLGRSLTDTPATVLWAGDLPGPDDRPARLTLVAVEQPSGAVVVTAPYGYAADLPGRSAGSSCATGVLPAGAPLDQRVVAVRCDLGAGTVDRELSRFLVVVGPRTASSVQLLDRDGAVLRELPLADGLAVVRSPGGTAQVRVPGSASPVAPLTDTDLGG